MQRWLSLGLVMTVVGCVLPDYYVVSEQTRGVSAERDAGAEPDAQQATTRGLSKLPTECSACAASECAEPHASCGDDCDALAWPISPALRLPDSSQAFVKCLANKCDAQCNVRWGCVENYRWDEPEDFYTVTIEVKQFNRNDPEVGARVTACLSSDPGCAYGSGMQSSVTTDEGGRALLTLSTGFAGYFLIEPQGDEYYPITMLWSQPIYRVHRTFAINLFKRSWLDEMAASLQVDKNDSSAGHVIFRAENCLPLDFIGDPDANAEAADVSVSFTPTRPDTTQTFYTGKGLTVDSQLMATTSTSGAGAYGGALNLPSALVTLVGSHAGQDVTRATMRLRANTLGLVHLVPEAR